VKKKERQKEKEKEKGLRKKNERKKAERVTDEIIGRHKADRLTGKIIVLGTRFQAGWQRAFPQFICFLTWERNFYLLHAHEVDARHSNFPVAYRYEHILLM
jgi:hypothetical protein